MKTELLAPAKNIEIAKQAINCGADAVYIGSVAFGARQNAANSIEDIKELVDYAHKFYVKVFVTVNTIVADDELDEVIKLIHKLYEIGVDALIVQDMAILKANIDGKLPPIPLHISTQCDNRLSEKIKFFTDMGLPRVVLARELSLNEIAEIQQQNPNLELECFIHGALCVSYSGQCYLSQFIGGRSANKGQCAQPCRKKYSLVDENGNVIAGDKHLLSLKDFNASAHIKDLVKIGVKSYKIEGRLKDELYVKNVVGYYRKELDKCSRKTSSGRIDLGFEPDLSKSFNRGYTGYFLKKRNKCFNFDTPKFIGEQVGKVVSVDKKFFKINLNKGVVLNNQDGLCFNAFGEKGCFINRIDKNMVYPNNMPRIKIGDIVYRNNNVAFEKSVLSSKTKRQIGVDIVYKNNSIAAMDENHNRVVLEIPETEPANNTEKMKENFERSISKTGDSDFYINKISIKTELPFIPVSKINEYRRILLENLMVERVKNYRKQVQAPLKYVDYFKSELDYRANVHNDVAKEFYTNCNACVNEGSFESCVPDRQVELMRTKHCLKYAFDMCKSPKQLTLIDEKGVKYPLKFDCKNCEMAILKP